MIDQPVGLHRQIGHAVAVLLQPLAGIQNRLVLGDLGDDVVAALAIHLRNALDGQVVALGGAGGKDDLLGGGADELGDLLARRLHGLLRLPAKGVVAAGRVAELGGEDKASSPPAPGDRAGWWRGYPYKSAGVTPAGTSTWLATVLIFDLHPSLRFTAQRAVGQSLLKRQCDQRPPVHASARWALFVFRQVLNTDAFQHPGDGFVHPRQRLLDGAARGQIAALRALGARGDEKRPVDGQNHFVGRDLSAPLWPAHSRRSCRHGTAAARTWSAAAESWPAVAPESHRRRPHPWR